MSSCLTPLQDCTLWNTFQVTPKTAPTLALRALVSGTWAMANKTGHKRSLKRVSTLMKCFKIPTTVFPKEKKKKIEVFEALRSFKHGYYLNQQDRSHALAASTHYSSAAHLPSYLRDVRVLYLGQGKPKKNTWLMPWSISKGWQRDMEFSQSAGKCVLK